MALTTWDLLAVRDDLLDRLRAEQQHRKLWSGEVICGQPAFVTHEAREMCAGVNRWRRQRGLELVSLADVLQVEQLASGHVDYATKYALYCAELAVGITPRELT